MVSDADNRQRLHQWITSLAITIVCCAVFFLIFSGHFLDLHKEVAAARVETGMLEARLNHLESQIMWEQRRQKVNVTAGAATPAAQARAQDSGIDPVPDVAVPVVGAQQETVPTASPNMPHEFNPDELAGTTNATPIVTPAKP